MSEHEMMDEWYRTLGEQVVRAVEALAHHREASFPVIWRGRSVEVTARAIPAPSADD